jgi:hypothetical protein
LTSPDSSSSEEEAGNRGLQLKQISCPHSRQRLKAKVKVSKKVKSKKWCRPKHNRNKSTSSKVKNYGGKKNTKDIDCLTIFLNLQRRTLKAM